MQNWIHHYLRLISANTESSNERITGQHWYRAIQRVPWIIEQRPKEFLSLFGKGTTTAVKQKLHEKFGIRNNVVLHGGMNESRRRKSVYPLSCWKILQARSAIFFLPTFRPHNTHGSFAVTQEERRQRAGSAGYVLFKGTSGCSFSGFHPNWWFLFPAGPRTRAPD